MEQRTELWWVLYPLKGLDVTDPLNDLLNNPLFGDATILSKNHIKDIVSSLKLNERETTKHDHERDLIFLMEHAGISGEFHSFMAVCRSSSQSRRRDKRGFVHSRHLDKKAKLRASQLVAALALSIMAASKTWQTCGMVEQFRDGTRPLAMICLKDGSFSLQGGSFGNARTIRSGDSTISLSRKLLLSLLDNKYTGTMMTLLINRNRGIGKSLHRALTESAICLSSAVHSIDLANQNLSSVTAIEILLANQGDSFETIKNRIISLIGEANFNYYKGNDTLHARHLYVHKALEPSSSTIANASLALALVCLCEYAQLAQRFKAKSEVISYLDFLTVTKSTSGIWNDQERSALEGLQRNAVREYKFPYFD